MTPGAQPQKTTEMLLLEQVSTDVREMKSDLKRFDRENLVLRTKVDRNTRDIEKMDEIITSHEKKISYFMGGSTILGVLLGFSIRNFDKLGTLLK